MVYPCRSRCSRANFSPQLPNMLCVAMVVVKIVFFVIEWHFFNGTLRESVCFSDEMQWKEK